MHERKRQKSIASYIHSSFGILVFAIVFTISSTGLLLSLGNNIRNAQDALFITTQVAADRIAWAVKSFQNSMETLGLMPALSNPEISTEEKERILQKHASQFGFTRCQILDEFGYSLTDGIYRGNRSYYTAALGGKLYISDPIVARSDGTTTLVVSAPLWKNGEYGTETVGVVWGSLNPETFNNLVSSLAVSKHSYAYIIGQTGNHVATSDTSRSVTGLNTILKSLNDPSLSKIASIERVMIDGKPGKTILTQKGVKLFSWHPVSNTPGWSLALQAPLNDYLTNFWIFGAVVLFISILTFFATRMVAKHISQKTGEPIHILADQLNRSALGDLNFDIEEIGSTEDVQLIAEASKNLVLRLNNTISFVDNYKANTNLSDFIDTAVIKQLATFYERGMFRGFHLIVVDNKGMPLVGERWINEYSAFINQPEFKIDGDTRPTVAHILIDGRIFGSVSFYLDPSCPLSDEKAMALRDTIAQILTIIGQTNFNRNVQNITHTKNLQDNIQNLVEMETTTSIYLQQLLYNLNSIRTVYPLFRRVALFKEIEKLADYSLDAINRAVDYSILNDLNASITEVPYTPSQLRQEINRELEKTGLNRKDMVTIITSDTLPSILYGDLSNISRVVTRIISNVSLSERDNFINITISAEKHSYATDISITISNPKFMLSSSQLARFNSYLNGDILALGTQNAMSNTALRFLSIVRIIRLINGSLVLKSSVQQGTAYVFTIPQIALEKEGTT